MYATNMFKDRIDAGRKLAEKLKEEVLPEEIKETILWAIPRGGIVVGEEIRKVFGIPMDCLVTKKIPSPESEELAIGAVAEGGTVVWEEELCERLNVPVEYKQEMIKRKVEELEKKKKDFRGEKALPIVTDKRVIITDDGVATGATVKAAVAVVKSFNPREIIVAVPVIAKETLEELKNKVDKIIYLEAPEMFFSVGQFYENFDQISDQEVKGVLK